MNNGFELVSLQVKDIMRERGVLYVGQYGTSGYAVAAKGYIWDFFKRGIPVSWTPLRFDDSELSDDSVYDLVAKNAINRKIPNVATVILHCTADLWPEYSTKNKEAFKGRNVIGYTVWETSQLPEKWPTYINESVNQLWCPSTYNKQVFEDSGVTIPVHVVPHVFLRNELPHRDNVCLSAWSGENIEYDPNVYTFYTISEFNERKNIGGLVKAFCRAFKKTDPVRLIIKGHYKTYSAKNLQYCIGKLSSMLKDSDDHAPVMAMIGNMTELQLLGLHSIGDCCISLTRSEAFGLTIFDAFNYGKKVIVTGHGGQVDYLGKKFDGLISYKMTDVNNMENFTHGYYMEGSQQWADPDIEHAAELMKKVANI